MRSIVQQAPALFVEDVVENFQPSTAELNVPYQTRNGNNTRRDKYNPIKYNSLIGFQMSGIKLNKFSNIRKRNAN